MKRKRERKSKIRRVIDACVYSVAVVLLFFSVILFMQEAQYVPQEVYLAPPPARAPRLATARPPISTPLPTDAPLQGGNEQPGESQSSSAFATAAPTAGLNTETTKKPSATPAPTAEPFDESLLHPVKLYFINQEVSCKVLPVAFTADNKMATIRSPYDAGWLYVPPYAVPGDFGKAVIAGHNRWNGKAGTFSILKKLKVGDKVAVEMSDGYAIYFTVDEVSECSYNDNTVMSTSGFEQSSVLVLITCKGDWDSALHTSRTRVVAICTPDY